MIEDMKKKIEDEFIPFELEVAKFGLFEIYPAKLVEYYEWFLWIHFTGFKEVGL